jgi:hypothetical protein
MQVKNTILCFFSQILFLADSFCEAAALCIHEVPKKIFGPQEKAVTGNWTDIHQVEFRYLLDPAGVVTVMDGWGNREVLQKCCWGIV